MSYQVLARKWRPQTFTEMVGQNHVLRALINAIDAKQLHHAYLFTGTRGVGKTTIARVLAKCLNCEQGITSSPCGTCSACVDIRDGKFVDLIEVDAASRTKVEQTRDLLENIAYAPTRGRYKIYLIDEVHMLSTHSFNALLKTLEEPPAHVIFLLATTDPDRLPMTILSRCLHFHLKNMTVETISGQLAHILTQEKISFERQALDLIAHAAQGSMRDSLSLLDQAIAYGAGKIETQSVRELLGHINPEAVLQILQALQQQQGEALLTSLHQLLTDGAEPQVILDELIQALHQIAVIQLVPERLEQHSILKPFAQHFSPQDVQLFYQIAVNGKRDLPWVANMRLGLEMILLRMMAFAPVDSTLPAIKPVVAQRVQAAAESKPNPPSIVEKVVPTHSWSEIAPQLNLTGLAMALASHCVLKSLDEQQAQLALAPQHAPLLNPSSTERLQQALSTYLGRKVLVKIHLEATGEETPALQQAQKQQAAQQAAEHDIKADPHVKAMMEQLGASIVKLDAKTSLS
ncbi:MAG: DNA polymerase III subunit gamma/tau [Gammaproteobacteria bacterium]|jgi:DNA polymerase-3 subunit gamma/tau